MVVLGHVGHQSIHQKPERQSLEQWKFSSGSTIVKGFH